MAHASRIAREKRWQANKPRGCKARIAARAAVAIIALVLTMPAGALADDTWGGAHQASTKWWECFHPLNEKRNCCSEQDGFVLSQKEWRIVPEVVGQVIEPPPYWAKNSGGVKSGYQIRIDSHGNPGDGPDSTWWDVRQEALIGFEAKGCGLDPQHPADAHVWISRQWDGNKLIFVWSFCFIAGTVE